jgi:hypothetical protein
MNPLSELDDKARAVILEGRYALDPTELTRARVRRAVESRLTAGYPATLPNSRWRMTFARLCAAILVTATVATGAIYKARQSRTFAIRPADTSSYKSAIAVSSVAALPSQSTSTRAPALELADATSAPSVNRTVVAPPPGSTSRTEELAEEIKLLSSANAAINAGDAGRALQLLREFDRRFVHVVLAEERAAAGIFALCAAGRNTDAKTAGKRFQTRWPRSPLLPRLSASCAMVK